MNIYSKRTAITTLLDNPNLGDDHHGLRFLVNPLKKSKRKVPVYDLKKLKIAPDADKIGQWSAPIDWNVTAIHSALLPDYSVMTFGTFSIIDKEKKDSVENKTITLSDGRKLKRDNGIHQWYGHDVNSGIDFDIWDFKKGFGDDSHTVLRKPVVLDSFCSVVRVLDNETVFIIGGNKNQKTKIPDTQEGTLIYNIKDKKFEKFQDLNYKRWYGSTVRTGDDHLIMLGGIDLMTKNTSFIPEIIDLKNFNNGWKILPKASSEKLFGEMYVDNHEWYYPRSYLSSDGNVVGISYDKIWVMDKNDDYRVSQTNEIELVTGGIAGDIVDIDQKRNNHHNHNHNHLDDPYAKNHHNHNNHKKNKPEKLKLVTVSSPVGTKNSTVMVGKDTVYLFGGKQVGDEYSSSNKVLKIDFSDSNNPIITNRKSTIMPRQNANATILPDGKILINGGTAYDDLEFSILDAEIYDPINQSSKLMGKGYFRRNYHSTALLLPNGTVLVSGGDVWNSEIFYPPYLFGKDWDGNTVLAERPEIINQDRDIQRGKIQIKLNDQLPLDIAKFTIISGGTTTHAQGSEPKFRSLNFSSINKNKFEIEIPENKNELQNGIYMIFAITKSGTPSNGIIVNLS